MDKILEVKTVITTLFILFVGWVFNKIYLLIGGKIKKIDSIEQLKKDFYDFKKDQREAHLEIKSKLEDIHNKIYK